MTGGSQGSFQVDAGAANRDVCCPLHHTQADAHAHAHVHAHAYAHTHTHTDGVTLRADVLGTDCVVAVRYNTMDKREKTDYILEQMRLCLGTRWWW